MKLLREISDATLGIGEPEHVDHSYNLKKSVRVILEKEDGTIAVQYLTNDRFHKLPGGGVENGETLEVTLARELLEEVGCTATIGECLGVVIEYREKHNIIQIGYGYTAQLNDCVSEPTLEEAEVKSGLTTSWMTPKEAVSKMKSDTPLVYQGPFIRERELAFLEAYLDQRGN